MSENQIKELSRRVKRLEEAVFGSPAAKKLKNAKEHSAREGLPTHILRLRSTNYFKQPRTASETRGKLNPTYHCDQDRVAMALLRLHKRKQLRKTSKMVGKTKQIAYVW